MRQVDTHRFNMKGCNKIYWAPTEKRKAGVAILISNKVNVKLDLIKRDREGYYILIKVSIDNEEISVLNMYLTQEQNTFLTIKTISKQLEKH